MMQHYPTHFDRVYGFECCTDKYLPTDDMVEECIREGNPNNYTVMEVSSGGGGGGGAEWWW